MKWWSTTNIIPIKHDKFNEIILSLVFQCPASTRTKESKKNLSAGKKQKTIYSPVSARKEASFKSREITHHLLVTLLAEIRRPLVQNNAFLIVDSVDDVVGKVDNLIKSTSLSDPNFELIVMSARSDMPKTEAIFYYIRNAFAHGSFEVISSSDENVYILESTVKKIVKARMRLKESTLLKYVKLSRYTIKDIKELQKKDK